jgi:hypothetical protein
MDQSMHSIFGALIEEIPESRCRTSTSIKTGREITSATFPI